MSAGSKEDWTLVVYCASESARHGDRIAGYNDGQVRKSTCSRGLFMPIASAVQTCRYATVTADYLDVCLRQTDANPYLIERVTQQERGETGYDRDEATDARPTATLTKLLSAIPMLKNLSGNALRT